MYIQGSQRAVSDIIFKNIFSEASELEAFNAVRAVGLASVLAGVLLADFVARKPARPLSSYELMTI